MKLKMQDVRIGTRIGLALALPIVVLFALSLWVLVGYHRTANNMANIHRMAELAPVVGALVHELQKERGTSVGALGYGVADNSYGSTFAKKLPERYRETDEKRDRLNRSLEGFEATRFGGNLQLRIAAAQGALGQTGKWRDAAASHAITATELAGHYSDIIAKLIGITEEMMYVSSDPGIAKLIAAYNNLMQAKERAGIERAIGSGGFSAGYFDAGSYVLFVEMSNQQRLYLDNFRLLAPPRYTVLLDRLFYGADAIEVERMRKVVVEGQGRILDNSIDAMHWFDTVTRRVDLLKELEDSISADLVEQAGAAEAAAKHAAVLVSALALALLGLTIFLASAIARGIILPLERMTDTIGKLAASDGNAEIKESERGDEIGALARAAMVFKENLSRVVQAKEQLRSEAILRMHHEALREISQGVLITDRQRNITYANAAFERITGYSEGEVLGRDPSFMYGEETEAATIAALRAALQSGQPFGGVIMNCRKDGTAFWNELSITPVLDGLGHLTQFVGVMRDVTELRRVEQELRISAAAFESLHGIMVTDADGVILRVNNAFTEMTGYGKDEVVGKKPSLFKSGRHGDAFYADMWRQLVTNGTWEGEVWDRRKNGEVFPKWQTISAVKGPEGHVTHYVAAFSDTSERKEAEEQIRHLAFFDPLTMLPNRRLLLDRLQQSLAISARSRRHGAMLFIDLDQFKTLNDTMGHDMGDRLLQQVASRLAECVRDGDTVARLGGDEFVVMLENLSDSPEEAATQAKMVGENILDALNQPYLLVGHEHHSTPSIGVTLYSGQDASIEELLKRADLAMYQSKASGRNAMHFFDPEMQSVITARATMEAELRHGLQQNEFCVHYQAQVGGSGDVIGAEILLRWQQPQRGMVPPGEFIPLAEETGLILPLGHWVLETACSQLAIWAAQPERAHLSLSVNVSARQFRHPDFVEQVLAVLEHTGANPHKLKLELTEGMLLDNVEDIIAKMSALKKHGVGFSLDDFGTGYSSLSYLKRLPLDQLKIDQSFVRDVLSDPNDAAIARTIVALGQSMGLAVIAEGVETEAQRAFLEANGCRAYQGYLFSKPIPVNKFEELVLRSSGRTDRQGDSGAGI
jgi:diguanylate cyclase (GGDEF)-like protein/PAS domain S-box-containing protein